MTQRPRRLAILIAAVLALAGAGGAWAQGNPEVELSNQARYWEERNRFDLARESWLKLLRIQPENTTAIAGLALAEARSGRASAAQVYLDRLRELNPEHPEIRTVESALRMATFDQSRLDEPRRLARAGQYAEAVDAYRRVFGDQIPDTRLGLEYYQTLAGTPDGWEPARQGIERLIQTDPQDPVYQVALAQHLTYREQTRRDGLRRLQQLTDNRVDGQRRQAWRQALIWLAATPEDIPLYRAFVRTYGDDPQITQKLTALERVGPGGTVATNEQGQLQSFPASRPAPAVTGAAAQGPTPEELFGARIRDAFERLNNGDIPRAEAAFQQLLAEQPGNADALGGLGIVMLRQERYAEARNLLEQASRQEPRTAQRWAEALASARFWEQVRSADAAREGRDIPGAIQRLRAALSGQPDMAARHPEIRATLADLLVEAGETAEAERIYRELYQRNPEDLTAVRGLIGIYSQTQRLREAIAIAEALPPRLRDQIQNLGQLRGQFLRDEAERALTARDEATAERLLKEALLLDPESPWTRLSLARIYQRQGRVREANTLVDGLITDGKQLADAYYIKALLLAEQQDWYNGLQVLERIPEQNRTPDMAQLQRRLWVRYETERAGVFARFGRVQEATQILAIVEPYVDETPELLGALATAWADVGDEIRAMSYIRQALSRTPNPDIGLRLQYAGLLFKLRQDAEFEVVMEDLIRQTGFTEQQSLDIANLRIAYRLRQADLVREEGNLAQAYEYLEPLLRVNPNDPRLLMALARLYNDAKEYERVIALNRRVLQIDPENIDAYRSAINAALAMNRITEAEELLDEAFALAPDNARLYALAGRAARARGEDGRALQLFQQALRLDQERGGEAFGQTAPYAPQLYLLDPRQPRMPPPGFSGFRPVSLPLAEAGEAKKKPLEPRLSRADRSLEAGTGFGGRLVRVSTPVGSAPPAAVPGAQGGVWVQQGDDVYVFQPGSPGVPMGGSPQGTVITAPPPGLMPAQRPAPMTMQPYGQPVMPQAAPGPVFPRDPAPRMSQRLSPGRYPSLREEVEREIFDITGPPPSPRSAPAQPFPEIPVAPPRVTPMAPAAPPVMAAPVMPLQPMQPVQPMQPMTGFQGAPVQVYSGPGMVNEIYEVPRIIGEPEVQWGAPVQAYERQGLRVLPPREPAPGMIITRPYPVPVYPQQMSPQLGVPQRVQTPAFPDRAPMTPALQLRQDPLLSRPAFAPDPRLPVRQERPNEILREIADLRARRSSWGSMGLSLRNRDGVQGLDRLYDIEMPVEFSFAGQRAGRVRLRAVPVYLDAGTLAGTELPLFGTLALVDPDVLAGRRFGQNATGVAVGASYEIGEFRADIGSTPLGFDIETIVGGLNWQPSAGNTSFKIDLSRRQVTDSLLSYAGAFDPGLAEFWGGVRKTGGRLDVAQDLGEYGLYGNVGYHFYDGENVADNFSYELGAGFYARALQRPDMSVTWGLNLTTFAYDKNLRRFTFGHGGYFSPQQYLALTVPVEWQGGRHRFSYRVNAALGIQGFREDGQALFPNDSGLQALIEEFVLDNPDLDLAAGYPGQSNTGVGFAFGAAFEYLIAANLMAGARFGLDNARDYNEAFALAYLRYLFTPQGRVNIPPAPLFPHYNFGDPRL